MIIDEEDYIAHYGVNGMHWGIINKSKTSGNGSKATKVIPEKNAQREAKAQRFLLKAKEYDASLARLNAITPTSKGQAKALEKGKKLATKFRDRELHDADATRNHKLTSGQKKLIVGGVIVAGLIAAKVVHTNIESGEFNRLAIKGEAFLANKKSFEFAKNAKLAEKNLSIDEIHQLVSKGVNPNYGALGTKQNCRRCTFAFEMRRRGYDVVATRTTNAQGQNVLGLMNAISPGRRELPSNLIGGTIKMAQEEAAIARGKVKTTDLHELNKIFAGGKKAFEDNTPITILNTLAKEPNGSRGEIALKWRAGGGHSVAYEIINGKPIVFDNQTGQMYSSVVDLLQGGWMNSIDSAGYTRLDNVDLNEDYLLRWLQNAQ